MHICFIFRFLFDSERWHGLQSVEHPAVLQRDWSDHDGLILEISWIGVPRFLLLAHLVKNAVSAARFPKWTPYL